MELKESSKKAYETTLGKFKRYEEEHGEIKTKEDVYKYFENNQPSSENAMYKELTVLRKFYNIDVKKAEVESVVNYEEIYSDRYLIVEEIVSLTRMLTNAQDSVLMVLGYYDLIGKDYEIMKNLKKYDVDYFGNKILGVEVDQRLMEVVKKAIEETEYLTLNETIHKLADTDYVLRPSITGKNLNSDSVKISSSLVRTRMIRVQQAVGRDITLTTLKNSYIVEKILSSGADVDMKKDLRLYLYDNNIKIAVNEFYKIAEVIRRKTIFRNNLTEK